MEGDNYRCGSNVAVLPNEVMEWAEIDTLPVVPLPKGYVSLTHCNDFLLLNFDEIADIIQECL